MSSSEVNLGILSPLPVARAGPSVAATHQKIASSLCHWGQRMAMLRKFDLVVNSRLKITGPLLSLVRLTPLVGGVDKLEVYL